MKKQIGNLLGRLKSGQRRRSERSRGLRVEALEGRRLLAADLSPNHNYFIAEDVNLDFNVSPLDSLLVINALNAGGSRSFAEGEVSSGVAQMLDVNGDNFLSPIDALAIINRLNAEGEDPVGTFISYSYEITTPSGTPITGNSVTVGDTFRINVFVKDVRPASARTITDPSDPSYVRFNGVFSAAEDLGVSDLSLVNFVRPSSFFSGVQFDEEFLNDQGAIQGGGIQIGGGKSPTVLDGQSFTITTASGTVTFEFDIAQTPAVTAGRTAIPLRALNPAQTDDALSYDEVASAMVTAIQGAGLGLTPVSRGAGIVGLPLDQFTLTPGSSSLTLSLTSQEYLNEVKAFQDRSRSLDPDGAIPFYSVDFTATAPGQVTFTPNGPDRLGSENLVFGSTVVIPNDMINFGMPFSVTISADITAPVALADTVATPEDTALVIGANVLANDTVTSPRTLSIDTVSTIPGVTLGTLSGTTYTPQADFFGTDRIVYTVKDSTGLTSAAATITINVSAVNDAPNAFNDSFSVDEGSTVNSLNLLDNGSGADNAGPANETSDSITITGLGAANSSTITTANGATVTIEAGGQSVNYVPATTFIGTDTFSYTITDSGNLTATATVTVEVAPGVLPFARRDTATGAEGGTASVAVLANDSTNPDSTAVLKSFTNGANGTVARQSSDPNDPNYNVLIYTPTDPEFFGSDTFTYVMNDTSTPGGADSTGTVAVTVTPVNDPPVLVNDTASTNEDVVLTIPFATLLGNDSPGAGEVASQTLTISAVNAVTVGGGTVALGTGNTFVYTPAANFNGPFVFTYTAVDNGSPALSETATVTVTVAAVNDNPIAGNDSVNGTEDTTLVVPAGNTSIVAGNVLFNDLPGPATATDEATQTLTVTGVSAASANGGTVSLAAGQISYTPAANFNGLDTFTYTISDGQGGTATGTVTVNVAAVNDTPVAVTDSVSGFRDVPLTIQSATLLANDNAGAPNEASQTLSVTAVVATANTNGQVVLNSDGTITYTPTAGFSGAASFEYTLRDSGGATSTGLVNVTIEEFVPSTIAGKVYSDDDADGILDSNERRLGGVQVLLTGTTAQGAPITSQMQLTLADGSYSFAGLGPGNYQVSYKTPKFLIDAPGPNAYSVAVNNPAGTTVADRNFAVQGGIDLTQIPNSAAYQMVIDQFASSRFPSNGPITVATDTQNILGSYFVVAADNTAGWSALPVVGANSGTVQFSEMVLSGSGNDMFAHLSLVDSSRNISTRTLSMARREFFIIKDHNGDMLIGVKGAPTTFESVNRATPPISVNKYLESVDTVFAQRGWA